MALTEGKHNFEFLLSEANGQLSREQVTVTVAGATALPAGAVLGKLTATGKYVAYDDVGSDGSEIAAAVLCNDCPATNGDYKRTIIARNAEVIAAMLTQVGTGALNANGVADLKTVGIIVR
jgi:hypothetical protein